MFQAGKIHCPTTYFLGYKTNEEGDIVIDDEQAEVVRTIFKSFLNGKGTPTIARELMKKGVLTARGNKKWTGDAVYKILKNEKYMGHCLAQKTVTVDFLTHKRIPNKNLEPQYLIKNSLPKIISEDDWNAVQQELKRRSKMLHDPDEKYRMTYSGVSPFSNKLFCGQCGRPVIRRRLTSQKNKEKYHFTAWHCRVAAGKDPKLKDCRSQYVWEEELEKSFMNLLYEMKENRDKVIKDARKVIKSCSLTKAEEKRLKELEKQMDAVGNRISELSARESTTNDTIYEATLNHLIYEQEILQLEYDGLNDNRQESLFKEKKLEELLNYLDELKEPDFNDKIFIHTVEKGILHTKHQVSLEFTCGIKRTITAKKNK